MSDVKVELPALEKAMGQLETYEKELEDLRAHVSFDLRSLFEASALALRLTERELADCGPEDREKRARLEKNREKLRSLNRRCAGYGQELLRRWGRACALCSFLKKEGWRDVGQYLARLNRLARNTGLMEWTVILDSGVYPETGDHIRNAIDCGAPPVTTLDRPGSDERREQSLQGHPVRAGCDRDEYPMACTREGGANAHVALIEPRDNRGAGSSLSWQLRDAPDGARVRIRIL